MSYQLDGEQPKPVPFSQTVKTDSNSSSQEDNQPTDGFAPRPLRARSHSPPSPPPTPLTPPTSDDTTETTTTTSVDLPYNAHMKWWWAAAQTTFAWTILVKALGLSRPLTAIFMAAPDVRQALQAYDEHYLQPLLASRAAKCATPLVPKPSSQELVAKVLPVGCSAYHEPKVQALWEDYFDEAARRTQERSHYRGSNHYLHASLASWRIMKWLQTEEAVELGLGDLCDERMPYNWGKAVSVVEVLLNYLYNFAGELQVSTISTEEEAGE